ncbi:MAG: hypothetical protein AAF611_01525 [Bacteroidota bacterium]
MKLPVQTKSVEHKTYNPNAVTEGVNVSFNWRGLLGTGVGLANKFLNG